MNVCARPASAADLPALLGLLQQLAAIEDNSALDPAALRRGLTLLLEQPEAAAFIAEHDGSPVGMACAQLLVSTARGGRVAMVEDVIVERKFRGRGVGRALLVAAEAWARAQGCHRLQLLADHGNAAALAFYARLGFGRTRMAWLVRQLG